MKQFYTLLAFMAITIGSFAQVVVNEAITENTTWSSDNEYLCDGVIYVESGATLTVEPGTVVKFKSEPTVADTNLAKTSALVITRGAKIMAEGTMQEPIIFTAEDDNLNGNLLPEDNGKWGGIIILGNAPAHKEGNTTAIQIEGIPSFESRGQYGGDNASDNSGTMTYCSIRFTGIGFAPGDEIQGLTLGGVGSGTTLDYIDIFSTADDGIEIFGGTVNIRHISVAFATDDSYDLDLGWRGKGQYLFALQRTDDHDHAGEWDGADDDDAPLWSSPDIYNATFIGPGADGDAESKALLLRDNFGGRLKNSILHDFPNKGIEVEDLPASKGGDSYQRMLDGELEVHNNTWSNFGSDDLGIGSNGIIQLTSDAENADAAQLISHLGDNNNAIEDAMIRGVSRTDDGGLDPRPSSNLGDLADLPNGDDFFDEVDYRGAFAANGPTWLDGWSTLAKHGFLSTDPSSIWSINTVDFNIFPNPANDIVTVSGVNADNYTVEVVDLVGKVMNTQRFSANNAKVNVSELNAGIYIVRVKADGQVGAQKITVE